MNFWMWAQASCEKRQLTSAHIQQSSQSNPMKTDSINQSC